uniref:Helicase-associated domain-containing protein n=1 Tax=Amphora coffeiformis TaxID=265554 RepID=A0A7S3LCQ6_9STRA|mmetsp:Transcript_10579/g.20366  ORF Transcript_10579/g.20366 Transcript_10579/m.20366 type:complete len:217 (+) Transcript_10579:87-737(+)|eukprot:scaffold4510_cov183-Amphora_coffeaeformis.AAC.65
MAHALWKVSTLSVVAASVPVGSCWLTLRSAPSTTAAPPATAVRFAFGPRLEMAEPPSRLYDRNNGTVYRPPSMQNRKDNDENSIVSPVLRQVYPNMIKHMEEYGNPNIPLGSSDGRHCETLRRLNTQNKLTEHETELLADLGFRWHNLEEVYKVSDFGELYQRLLQYRQENDGDVSPPKKYPKDPELDAWVAGLRRRGPDQVDPVHRVKLDEIEFV